MNEYGKKGENILRMDKVLTPAQEHNKNILVRSQNKKPYTR